MWNHKGSDLLASLSTNWRLDNIYSMLDSALPLPALFVNLFIFNRIRCHGWFCVSHRSNAPSGGQVTYASSYSKCSKCLWLLQLNWCCHMKMKYLCEQDVLTPLMSQKGYCTNWKVNVQLLCSFADVSIGHCFVICQICYGTTENSPVTFQSFVDDSLERRVTTIGTPGAHIEVSEHSRQEISGWMCNESCWIVG